MKPFPRSFPSPLHLPFNTQSLRDKFCFGTPDQDPGCNDGVFVALHGTELLVREGSGEITLPCGDFFERLAGRRETALYIGTWEEKPCFALSLSEKQEIPACFQYENMLANEPRLPITLLSLAGTVGQILHWEETSHNCSLCGGEMERLPGEWGKKCLLCGYAHFPHIHPCIIVLIRRKREVLLVRNANWPAGRYSLVAGFLNFGECLEEAVTRETMEETGVRIKNIRYVGSQCWPFPSQLMAGFTAEYDGGEVKVQEKELEDARWFPVDALPVLPPKRSIARYLLDHYCTVG
jgi:NAD+ diphosphatase